MKKHNMVPEHSVFQAISASTIGMLPEKFYDRVEEGSIVLKKAKAFSFCKNGVVVQGQDAPIESDVVIFATGYRGDQKLRNMFTSTLFQRIVAGSSGAIPLYR